MHTTAMSQKFGGFGGEADWRRLGAVIAMYDDWSPELVKMLTQVEGNIQRWPPSAMPADCICETKPGLAMVGDSSHAMPPFTGKGVNPAMPDSLEQANGLMAGP